METDTSSVEPEKHVLLTEAHEPTNDDAEARRLTPVTPGSHVAEILDPESVPVYEDPYQRAVTYMEKHHILHIFRVGVGRVWTPVSFGKKLFVSTLASGAL